MRRTYRKPGLIALAIFLFAIVFCAIGAADDTIASLKARLEHTNGEERPGLCVRIAQLDEREANRLYADGKIEDARATVEEIAIYFEKARDAAIEAKAHLKNVEIDARKMSAKLNDLKRTLAFEDQAPVGQAIKRIEDVRTALLQDMFANKKKDKK